jgi:integrase
MSRWFSNQMILGRQKSWLPALNLGGERQVAWEVIERMPCTIRLLPIPKSSATFHDFDDYEKLVEAAKGEDQALLIVLLGEEAGLRCGEMMALEWSDVDLTKRQLCVQRSEWKGHVTTTKSGRLRYVRLTNRLAATLRQHRHLRGPRVLCADDDGRPFTQREVQGLVRRAARRANLSNLGVHILRRSFCSHLAMLGAPARAIQELAGHQEIVTTQRYMHLSPAAIGAPFACSISTQPFKSVETCWRRLKWA